MAVSRRDEILSLAADQFAERGVAGTTVRDIGTAAGILSGSLYHHFTSKDQMVAELLLPVMQRQVGHYREIVGANDGAATTLRSLITTAVAEAAATPNQTRMIRNDSSDHRRDSRVAIRRRSADGGERVVGVGDRTRCRLG